MRLCICNKYKNISIPYGAIKRVVVDEQIIDEIIFQFLMVRLKELHLQRWNKKFKRISIPYGAIKSGFSNSDGKFVYSISIPYGAIKSNIS